MSYPQFNLTTLQLPAPDSNMTKAEYKAAYGIDLDEVNIKAFKLVLLGNDKYPIDQIKEVEGGYEIYFNGSILSITDTIQTSSEVYDMAYAKPIYCHPISIIADSGDYANTRLCCLLFNSSSTPYTKTSLIELISDFVGRLSFNGSIVDGDGVAIASYVAGGNLVANNVTDGTLKIIALSVVLGDANVTLTDNVNKIN